MMHVRKAVTVLTLIAASFPSVALAQSPAEWLKLDRADHLKAEAQLQPTLHAERKKAIEHYVTAGDQKRAHFIATMHPDIDDIRDCAVASQFKKGATMEDVVHTYIVQWSAQGTEPKVQHK